MTSIHRGSEVRSETSQLAVTFAGEPREFNTVHVGRLIEYLDDLSYVAHHFGVVTDVKYRLSAPTPRERLLEWNGDLEILLPVRGEWTPIIKRISYNSPFVTILQWGGAAFGIGGGIGIPIAILRVWRRVEELADTHERGKTARAAYRMFADELSNPDSSAPVVSRNMERAAYVLAHIEKVEPIAQSGEQAAPSV